MFATNEKEKITEKSISLQGQNKLFRNSVLVNQVIPKSNDKNLEFLIAPSLIKEDKK